MNGSSRLKSITMHGKLHFVAAILLMCFTLNGCGLPGSTLIHSGRPAYNDAIVATNSEQMLDMIVRMRYREPSGLLVVSSVTANVRVQTTVGAQFGVGPSSNFTGNLVPLSAGALYEDSPTISYTPVQGQEHMRLMLAPLPLELLVMLLNAIGQSSDSIMLLIEEMNGIRNPEFITDPSVPVDPRFERIAQTMASLQRRGCLIWGEEPGTSPSFVLLLRGEGDAYATEVALLHELLGLAKPQSLDENIMLSVRSGVGSHDGDAIRIRCRSVYDLLQIAAASVDVPAEHLESGLAPPLPPLGGVAGQINIRRSESRPKNAQVAVMHHGWWYAIEATDARSKQVFLILESIITARIADSANAHSSKPVLTVPAAR